MKITALVCLVLLSSPLMAAQVGQTAVVPTLFWVEIRNAEVVHNGNGTFSTGERCSIARAESIKAVALENGQVLAEYVGRSTHEVPDRHFGAECPLGTLFLISSKSFGEMTDTFFATP